MRPEPGVPMSQAACRPSGPGRLSSLGVTLRAGEENITTVLSALVEFMKGYDYKQLIPWLVCTAYPPSLHRGARGCW